MRWLIGIAMFAVIGMTAFAQEKEQDDLPLKAPQGWFGEIITLPPGFAKDMKLRGVEKIRFAPGMFKPDAADFFSYVFVFRVDAEQELSAKVIHQEIMTYYKGLATSVGGKDIDTSKFVFDLKAEKKKQPAGISAYAGQLKWIEPFKTKKPQILGLELHAWAGKAKKYRYLFCSASPAKPDATIWKQMRKIRDAFIKAVPPAPKASPEAPSEKKSSSHWPSFRGSGAIGVSDGQNLPDKWDGAKGENIRWKTRIPGLAHSSPVVWGHQIFITSAISAKANAGFKPGLYGAGTASEDRSQHQWVVICLDKSSGKTLWQNVAVKGVPKDKRHIKATYANGSPATDGRYVVAFFGSQGLYCFDMDGKRQWAKDLGRLDVGAYDSPTYEWGSATSPIIYRDSVIVQCDAQKGSFILAVDIKTGKTLWKVKRDELPTWGTPTICNGPNGPELVTNGSKFIRAYDPATGKELWRLGGSSKITAPTPFLADGLIIAASGRHPERPLFAIHIGSRGDLTLGQGQTSSKHIAWSKARGSYMPTPLAYRGLLYILNNNGRFDCYELKTGKEIYRQRIKHAGSGFSASPIAADGKIYLPSEDGDIFVIKAGREFEQIAKNPMGENLMATPALSEGTMFVRAREHLIAVGR